MPIYCFSQLNCKGHSTAEIIVHLSVVRRAKAFAQGAVVSSCCHCVLGRAGYHCSIWGDSLKLRHCLCSCEHLYLCVAEHSGALCICCLHLTSPQSCRSILVPCCSSQPCVLHLSVFMSLPRCKASFLGRNTLFSIPNAQFPYCVCFLTML